MTIEDGKIVKATEGELFGHYLKTGYDDIMPFDEYKRKCMLNGTEIIEDGEAEKPTDSEVVKAIPLENQIEQCNKRIKEVFEQHYRRNTNGCEDPLEIFVLRDCSKLISTLNNLINRLQAENENYSKNNRQMTSDILKLYKELEQAKAENERLQKAIQVQEIMLDNQDYTIKRAKAEAYKECIQKIKVKSKKEHLVCSGASLRTDYTITKESLDNILKELGGEDNG